MIINAHRKQIKYTEAASKCQGEDVTQFRRVYHASCKPTHFDALTAIRPSPFPVKPPIAAASAIPFL
jgi:hypothetical protein